MSGQSNPNYICEVIINESFQENLSHLLATVFKLNISGNLNTIPHIVTAINTINTTAGNN